MIFLPSITEIEFAGVFDRGVPNSERVVLKVLQTVRLAEYAVCLAAKTESSGVFPLTDQFFWFNDEALVEPPYSVYLYTGPGQTRRTHVQGTGTPAIVFHWGRNVTLLDNSRVEPVLFRIGAMLAHGTQQEDLSKATADFLRTLASRAETAKTLDYAWLANLLPDPNKK